MALLDFQCLIGLPDLAGQLLLTAGQIIGAGAAASQAGAQFTEAPALIAERAIKPLDFVLGLEELLLELFGGRFGCLKFAAQVAHALLRAGVRLAVIARGVFQLSEGGKIFLLALELA